MTPIFKRAAIAALALSALACGVDAPSATEVSPKADTVFYNAAIWTGVDGENRAEAIAVKANRIIAIGSPDAVHSYSGDDTSFVDLNGAFVVPGFIDNHTHFLPSSFGLASVQLRDAQTKEEFVERIAEFVKTQPKGRWILEGTWDHELWGGELPHKDWIDALTPDHPVLVRRLDGHMALANSLALNLAGIAEETPDPVGGEFVRDENGALTGIVKDTAKEFIENTAIPAPTEQQIDEAHAAGMKYAIARGVTQIHDMEKWESLASFRRLRERGELDFRVYSFTLLADWERLEQFVEDNGRGDEWHRWGGLKGFVDGSLGLTSAVFHEPYTDAPHTSGLLRDTVSIKADLKSADAAGLHVAIHAIGDRANDWLLDAYAETISENGEFQSPLKERRFRIEHAQHLSAEAIGRFAELNVIPSMHPYHTIDDGRWAESRIGSERIKRTYAFRSLIDADAKLTFGSDFSIAPIDPLLGIYAAVTRRTFDGVNPDGWAPEQKITVEEALRAYTSANAYGGYQEDDLGTLEVGKLADFVVLSANLLVIDPTEIENVKVLRTVIGGDTKYLAD